MTTAAGDGEKIKGEGNLLDQYCKYVNMGEGATPVVSEILSSLIFQKKINYLVSFQLLSTDITCTKFVRTCSRFSVLISHSVFPH